MANNGTFFTSTAFLQQILGGTLGIHVQAIYDWLDVVTERYVSTRSATPFANQRRQNLRLISGNPCQGTFDAEYSLAHMHRMMERTTTKRIK